MEYCFVYPSPLGPLTVTCRDGKLRGLYFRPPTEAEASLPSQAPTIEPVKDWLDRYFAGQAPAPGELPLQAEGSPFRETVWRLLLTIPYGEVRTYGELAREAARILGKEKMSAQAIGGAVGRNPIPIIIPCHRVVAAGGKLGGFGWGEDAKRWLLRHEGHVW